MGESSRDRLAEAFAELPQLAGLPDHRAFERLAAMVTHRWLDERAIHDISLRGSSLTPHQIDVLIGGDDQRALIECKYYARRIDLPVVRNFFAVVEDLGCDLAAIVTTVGYSQNAKTYADAKGIDLLVLREAQDEDLEGRITRIQLDIEAVHVGLRSCRIQELAERSYEERSAGVPHERELRVELDDPAVVIEYASGRRVPFADRFYEHYNAFGVRSADGVYPVSDVFESPTWLAAGDDRFPIERIDWVFTVSRSTHTTLIEHAPLLSLVDHDGAVLEVVSEEQLARIRLPRHDHGEP